jgi:hypothetical protein
MSLQKMHKFNKMKFGSERKMTCPEFNTLMDNAYAFLGVKLSPDVAQQIFQETDTDKDNLITYVEYFQIIEKYVCKSGSISIKLSKMLK